MSALSRIKWLTLSAVLVTAITVSAVALFSVQALLRENNREALRRQTISEASPLGSSLRELHNDVRLLVSLPLTRLIASGREEGVGDRGDVKSQLAEVLTGMLRAKPAYSQARLIGIDRDGQELVRVDRAGVDIVRCPEDQLQRKGGRDYFQGALALAPPELYTSKIDLNQEHGGIEFPHRAMLRVASRVDSAEGRPLGIVIINLDFNKLIGDLYQDLPEGFDLYITNPEGDYLTHPDPSMTFGFDLGTRHRVQDDVPDARLLFEGNGLSSEPTQEVWSRFGDHGEIQLARVNVFPGDSQRFLVLGLGADTPKLGEGGRAFMIQTAWATLLLVLCAAGAAMLIGRWQTRPVEQMTSAALSVASGAAMPLLPVELDDELGALARAVNEMNASLQERQRELSRANQRLAMANDDLEHFVHIAAHDLREPLRKQRKLIDLVTLDDGPLPRADAELLSHVRDCSNKMQAMVDDFRALTRLGLEEMVRQSVSLPDLIQSVLDENREELERRGVGITFDTFPSESDVYPGLVRILYDNLVRNALQHVGADAFELRFTAERRGEAWLYGVRNTNSTIPQDKLTEVFKLFRRSNPALSEGTGIGLSACKKIVDRHRGEIYAESTRDTVHVRFTLKECKDVGSSRERE